MFNQPVVGGRDEFAGMTPCRNVKLASRPARARSGFQGGAGLPAAEELGVVPDQVGMDRRDLRGPWTDQAYQWFIPVQDAVGVEPAEGDEVVLGDLPAFQQADDRLLGMRALDGQRKVQGCRNLCCPGAQRFPWTVVGGLLDECLGFVHTR